MPKTSHVWSMCSARLDASSGSYSGRLPRRQDSSTASAQECREPRLTPAEVFVRLVCANARNVAPDINTLCPGAEVPVLLKIHVEETRRATSTTPLTYVLVVRVEAPLPTGGTHTARLDSWEKDAARPPLWLTASGMPDTSSSPLQLHRTLGWLHTVVSGIEAQPTRCEGDVWWRFLLFVNNVKEAYHVAPPSQTSDRRGIAVRPRPRPRPHHAELNKLVEALAMLRVTDDDGHGEGGAVIE